MSEAPVERIFIVYDADGGLLGELAYVVGKVAGKAHCALCDITHGLALEKDEWKACKVSLGIPVDQLHRNELKPGMQEVIAGELPCVVGQTADGYRRMLGPEEIAECGGSVRGLELLLKRQLPV